MLTMVDIGDCQSVRRKGEGHVVRYRGTDGSGEEWQCDAVAVCSGLHVLPHLPELPGLKNVPTVMHSSDFKARAQFGKDKTVVILGAGETAMDLGYLIGWIYHVVNILYYVYI